MAFSFTNEQKYTLTSVGFSADECFPVSDFLQNIFRRFGRKLNYIKLIEFLVCLDRSTDQNKIVTKDNIKAFCRFPNDTFISLFDGLYTENLIEWNEDTIIIRYDTLLNK